jgi:nicotinamide-nucleotide amidase
MIAKKRVSVLAIGNELLLGQIINKNAALISEKLLDYNLRSTYHCVVADDVAEIITALNYLWSRSDIIFVCGGLGPTEDDLTREAITQFMKTSIHQDDVVLKELKLKLQKRGVQFTLNHIKQAQFPTGGKVMKNDVGTADGFHLNSTGKDIFAVPGPWIEIESCWKNYIHDKLKGISLTKIQIERFQIIGLPESEVSQRTQDLLKGSPFNAEYRLHTPFVELRIDVDPIHQLKWKEYDQRISEEFKEFIVGKGNVDKAKEFVEKIKDKKVLFVDAVSQGYFAERLLPLTKDLKFDFFQIASLPASYAAENYEIFFEVRPVGENEWLGLIDNSTEIPIKRLSERKLRPDFVKKKMAELFFWKLVDHL